MSYFTEVYRWNHKAGHYLNRKATIARDIDGQAKQQLALDLVSEEFFELEDAIVEGDPWLIADACADLVWVVCGLSGAYGIDLDSAWSEVKRTNNEKLGGPRRDDGKLLKPEGWKPPDMSKALETDLGELVKDLI